jgi:hypothetical protein
MFGPGEYVPDPTEGIVDANDLPKPISVSEDHNYDRSPCPWCGQLAYRHKLGQRTFHGKAVAPLPARCGYAARAGHIGSW